MNHEHGGPPLRRRVLVSIMAVTVVAVVLFTLPLGIAVQRLYRSETVTALQRDAARAAAVVPDTIPGGPVSVPSRRFLVPEHRRLRHGRAAYRRVRTGTFAPWPRAAPGPRSGTPSRASTWR